MGIEKVTVVTIRCDKCKTSTQDEKEFYTYTDVGFKGLKEEVDYRPQYILCEDCKTDIRMVISGELLTVDGEDQ